MSYLYYFGSFPFFEGIHSPMLSVTRDLRAAHQKYFRFETPKQFVWCNSRARRYIFQPNFSSHLVHQGLKHTSILFSSQR